MYRDQERYGRDPREVVRSKTTFRDPLKWADGRKVFTCSWSDFFIEDADPWRAEAWDIIRQTPQHTYQILTKRPELIRERLPEDWGAGWPHVWLGVSVETQQYASERIPVLLATPAALRFLSCEPLLGRITFPLPCRESVFWGGVRWIIVGGESGSPHRVMDMRSLGEVVTACRDARCPVWVKQDSGDKPGRQGRIPDDLWIQEFPAAKGDR
jgi:protein gp37